MTYRAAVALGSNLGDRLGILRSAVHSLAELGDVVAVSSLYETAPVGGPDQGAYLNAVVVVDTELDPLPLLRSLQGIETEAGRVRDERWGPRTLDLDIVTITGPDGEVVNSDDAELTLPHPRAHERRFVLRPLADVWEDAPLTGGLAADLLASVRDQEVDGLGSDWVDARTGIAWALLSGQLLLFAVFFAVLVATGTWPGRVGPVAVGGAVVAVAGAGVAIWGVAALGPALSPLPEPKAGGGLVTEGPFRFVRHPIYAGIILGGLGLAWAGGSWPAAGAAVVLGVYLWSKARYEESRLRIAVAGYGAYMSRVGGRFFPGQIGPG